jgi:hypothetical protein
MSGQEPHTLRFNGVDGSTGGPLFPPATPEELAGLACGERWAAGELEELRQWRQLLEDDHLDTRCGIEARDLAEAGWGVVFPETGAEEEREALAPLLAWRRRQAGARQERRFRELTYLRGESKARFLARHGVGPGPVDPDQLPYYLLLVGSPEEIPFGFQFQLDVQYAVGRLSLARAEDYARYAAGVVAAESNPAGGPRRASFFGVAHDPATELSLERLVEPLASQVGRGREGWTVEGVLGPAATKAALGELLGGPLTPALLFTASHGLGFPAGEPRQFSHQGALLCQDWPGTPAAIGPPRPDHYLAAEDVGDSACVAGLVAFFFACYGAGTPSHDGFAEGGKGRRRIARESFMARLPQRLLSHPRGAALAVVGHVDRAWSLSFDWPLAGRQVQVFESALERLLEGYPVGAAMEVFGQRYAEVSSDLSQLIEEVRWGARPDFLTLADLWTANNDARSYVVLGDPAVRLSSGPGAAAR